jgi:hypothetical protein
MRPYLLLLLAASACTPPRDEVAAIERDAPAGPCSVGAAGERSVTGVAAYSEIRSSVPGGGATAPGTRGVTLTCMTPGAGGTAVTLMLPLLNASSPAAAGRYRVERPGGANADARLAWAEVQLTVSAPARYVASGGEVHIVTEHDGILEGSYQLALDRSPEADPRYPERQVLWGAFRAPSIPTNPTARER